MIHSKEDIRYRITKSFNDTCTEINAICITNCKFQGRLITRRELIPIPLICDPGWTDSTHHVYMQHRVEYLSFTMIYRDRNPVYLRVHISASQILAKVSVYEGMGDRKNHITRLRCFACFSELMRLPSLQRKPPSFQFLTAEGSTCCREKLET